MQFKPDAEVYKHEFKDIIKIDKDEEHYLVI